MRRLLFTGTGLLAALLFVGAAWAKSDSASATAKRCRWECAKDYRACLDEAANEFATCVETECGDVIDAAKAACEPDDTVQGCLDARAEAARCVRECRDELRDDMRACRLERHVCFDNCRLAE